MAPNPRSEAERTSAATPAWAEQLVRLLDDGFTIPGTRIGIGLDAVLGFLLPTLGDALTGLASLSLLVLAFQMRLPKVIVLRVVFNIALDVLLGCVPLVGDAFDLFFRSNRRNLQLLQRYSRDPLRRPDAVDYLIVGLGFALVAAAIVLPLILGAWLLRLIGEIFEQERDFPAGFSRAGLSLEPEMHPASDPPRDLFVGQVLESAYQPGVSYRLEKKLGEGGTAVAYLTRRISPVGESQAVIKIILPQLVAESDERALTIIKKEAVALGRLNERVPPTPFVVRLLDTGSVAFRSGNRLLQLPFIALEYVHGGLEGATLEERVEYSLQATGFSFDPERAARLIRGLAKGLDEIHAVGVVHRDLSPGNVLCCGSGESELFKISDFGIARPAGLSVTFGNMLVGTPGYLAPEQIVSQGGDTISARTDIFSFAAIVYFVLTGDPLFNARTAVAALMLSRAPERRSLLDSKTLPDELRERDAACQAIDLAIARATSLDPKLRPPSAQRFADSLLPWIESRSSRPSRRWVSSMDPLRSREMVIDTQWMVRNPPGDDRLVLHVAWNAAGHALATTTQGLAYWDGTRWCDLPTDNLPAPGSLRVVERLTPATWVVGGSNATLFEYSRDGVRELFRGPDRDVTINALTTGFDDIAVVLGNKPGCPPLLYALIGKHWLRPLPVTDASMIADLSRIDDERWLVVGRGHDGRPYAAYYRPLDWQLDRVAVPDGRALLACASSPERQTAVAVGVGGACLEIDAGVASPHTLAERPDLSCIAIDTLGRHWAAGPGRVWSRLASGAWQCVWQHPAWQPPFVSIMAEIGTVTAMTVDGAVLECRPTLLDKTYPAI